LVKGGELQGIALKVHLWKRGIEGDLKIREWNEFMADALTGLRGKYSSAALSERKSEFSFLDEKTSL
jgi:hypothetical protein